MRTLLVDNHDSFTYNLYQFLGEVNGEAPLVLANDDERFATLFVNDFDNIVVSPGPGRPDRARDFGWSARTIVDSTVPVLGVCLGHQGICQLFGGQVVRADRPMHGRTSAIHHNADPLFSGIPSPFSAVRYHSLIGTGLPGELERIAWTDSDEIMAVRHRNRPIWGVQFHPESICSSFGRELIGNFRRLTEEHHTPRHQLAVRANDRAVRQDTRQYRLHVAKVMAFPDPELVYRRQYLAESHAFWLDSSSTDHPDARFSFLGDASGPHAEIVSYRNHENRVTVRSGDQVHHRPGPLLGFLDAELRRRTIVEPVALPFPFSLGYVGYLGYELRGECGSQAGPPSAYPDAQLLFVDRMIVFDHRDEVVYLVALTETGDDPAPANDWLCSTTEALEELAGQPSVAPPVATAEPVAVDYRHDRDEYLRHIDACQEYIRAGESYEVCLTNMAHARIDIDPFTTYRHLRRISPVPFGAFLRFGELTVLSSSPERFLSADADGQVRSTPIKGTRPRGHTPAADESLRADLAGNEKDRAENLMIVDLVRNDLNSVCVLGSVHVPRLFHVESFATVHHLVSTVLGRLRPGLSVVDCVRAAFPGGSMTGAPKLRTMEIIDSLEQGPRGVYSGALGYFSLTGAADLSMVIRTIVHTPGLATFGVGGAILALSDPVAEYDETQVKAAALIRALRDSEGVTTETRLDMQSSVTQL